MPGTLVIIGRPNVGKSTLFNRLAGRRLALVDDQPGVTRDRREAPAQLGDLVFTVVDTAGLEDAFDDSLTARMRRQTERALQDASVILMLVDARAGILPLDREFADWVRRMSIPVVLGANKAEGRQGQYSTLDAFELGLGDPVPLSAEHGEGLGALYDAVSPYLSEALQAERASAIDAADGDEFFDADSEDEQEGGPLRLAIVGRPNVGKSTLINALLNDERLLTGPEPGITRDAITVQWRHNDRDIALIDTAGLRRKARIDDKVEKLSATDTLKAIRFAHVAVLVLDATDMLEKQDLAIARHIVEEGRAMIIAANKWDLIADKSAAMQKLTDRLQTSLPQLKGVKVVTLSAQTGYRLETLLPAVTDAYDLWNRRIATSDLNDWLAHETERHPPPLSRQKRRIKIRYATQAKTRPPTFILFTSRPEDLPDSYVRYLENSLRAAFELPGTPIRMLTRKGKNPYAEKK